MRTTSLLLLVACNATLQDETSAPSGKVTVTISEQEVLTACVGEENYPVVLDVHVDGGSVTLDVLAIASLTDDTDMILEEVYGPKYVDLDNSTYLGYTLDEGTTRYAIKAVFREPGIHAFLVYALSYEGSNHGMLAEGLPKATGLTNVVSCE